MFIRVLGWRWKPLIYVGERIWVEWQQKELYIRWGLWYVSFPISRKTKRRFF